MPNFERGKLYVRRKLHDQYGGQPQSGISTPENHNFIMLFTGDTGKAYGYRDGWNGDGIFFYTGEGQNGDMQFVRGNASIRDHEKNGKDLFLFRKTEDGFVRFIDQFVCTGYHYAKRPDKTGELRNAIIFELTSQSSFSTPSIEEKQNP